jgi:large subunit ribosomal protein L13
VKTYQQKPAEVQRDWFVVDAQGKVLGRLASRIASILRGKHKPTFTPHVDGGDFVVVVNAEKVRLTGRKLHEKVYYWHSGYPGGIKSATAAQMLDRKPEWVIQKAVQRMLPKNPLGRRMLRKLKVYRGPEHPHAAQQPKPLDL